MGHKTTIPMLSAVDKYRNIIYCINVNNNKNIMNIRWNPQASIACGYILVSDFQVQLADSRDVSHMLLN